MERLEAVPAWLLVKSPGFLDKLGGESTEDALPDSAWQRRLERRIRLELERLLAANQQLATMLELEFGANVGDDGDIAAKVSEALAADPLLVAKVAKIRGECRNRGLSEEAGRLEEIENFLLPRLFPRDERIRLWKLLEKRHVDVVLVEHAVASPAGAEGWVASLDQRPVDFPAESRGGDVSQWTGRASHKFSEVNPGDLSPDCVAYRILVELSAFLGPDQIPLTEAARKEIVSGRAIRKTVEESRKNAERLGAVLNKSLRTRKAIQGRQYCLIRVDQTKLTRERLKSALSFLRVWVPDLDFLEISKNPAAAEHEAPMIELLRQR